MHWCADETAALMSVLGSIPFAWRWVKMKGKSVWRSLARLVVKPVPHEVVSDGKTVWVNGGEGLLGRFGPLGIDVHLPASAQADHGECAFCTHGLTCQDDWKVFQEKMYDHFGIKIPREHAPTTFAR